MAKWDKWGPLSQDMEEQEIAFQRVYELWKDMIAEEESERLSQRHEEIMNAWKVNELIRKFSTSNSRRYSDRKMK